MNKLNLGAMKGLAGILILAPLLSACPPVVRIYVHNDSESVLTYYSPLPTATTIVIRPGRTKYFGARPDISACAEIDVGGRKAFFAIQNYLFSAAKHKGYGARLDVVYQDAGLFLHQGDEQPVRIAEVPSCDDVWKHVLRAQIDDRVWPGAAAQAIQAILSATHPKRTFTKERRRG